MLAAVAPLCARRAKSTAALRVFTVAVSTSIRASSALGLSTSGGSLTSAPRAADTKSPSHLSLPVAAAPAKTPAAPTISLPGICAAI